MYPLRTCTIKLLQTIKTSVKSITTSVTYFEKNSFSRRTIMYIPCADERKLMKIPSLEADTVVLDYEDGVSFNQKVVCIVIKFIQQLWFFYSKLLDQMF